MKFNWRVLIAIVIVVGAAIWGIDSLRNRSYSGSNLNFVIGGGPVTVTNPSEVELPVQLVSTRSFSVTSSQEALTGRSATEGSGRNTSQLFAFLLPVGTSEFTITRGTNVNFVATTDTSLDASVEPLSANDARTTLLVMAVAMLGSLFYMSSVNGHRWISASRRDKASNEAAAKEAEQQNFKRMFTSDKSGRANKG